MFSGGEAGLPKLTVPRRVSFSNGKSTVYPEWGPV